GGGGEGGGGRDGAAARPAEGGGQRQRAADGQDVGRVGRLDRGGAADVFGPGALDEGLGRSGDGVDRDRAGDGDVVLLVGRRPGRPGGRRERVALPAGAHEQRVQPLLVLVVLLRLQAEQGAGDKGPRRERQLVEAEGAGQPGPVVPPAGPQGEGQPARRRHDRR